MGRHIVILAIAIAALSLAGPTPTLAQDVIVCASPRARQLARAVARHCAALPMTRAEERYDCEGLSELELCEPGRTVDAMWVNAIELVIHSDCWWWYVALTPPAARTGDRGSAGDAGALLQRGWRIASVRLDVSHCD